MQGSVQLMSYTRSHSSQKTHSILVDNYKYLKYFYQKYHIEKNTGV